MRGNLLFIFGMVVLILLSSQEAASDNRFGDSTFKARIGIHGNMDFRYTPNENSIYDPWLGVTTQIRTNEVGLSIKPGFRMSTKRGNALELNLERFEVSIRQNETILIFDTASGATLVSGQLVTSFYIGPRSEFSYIFLKNSRSGIKPYLGLSTELFFKYTHNTPLVSNLFKTSNSAFGTIIMMIPGVMLEDSEKYYFTISVPIDFGSLAIKSQKTDNPALPEATRRTTTFDYDYIYSFRLRVTYGVYIR